MLPWKPFFAVFFSFFSSFCRKLNCTTKFFSKAKVIGAVVKLSLIDFLGMTHYNVISPRITLLGHVFKLQYGKFLG